LATYISSLISSYRPFFNS